MTMRFSSVLLALALSGCSAIMGPDVDCHTETVIGPPATVTPPDSLHLPTVTFQITTTKRICTRQ